MWRRNSLPIIAGTVLAHWVLWLAYTNSVGFREIIAGAVAAAISTVAVQVVAVQGRARFRFRWNDVFQCVYLPLDVLKATWAVIRALVQQLFTAAGPASGIVAVPFDCGGDDPISHGRRALAISYTTITPNSVVLGIAREQKLMVYHQLLPGKVSSMMRHLGARP